MRGVVLLVAFAAALNLGGCESDSANMRSGDDQPYASLGDQRAAALKVAVVDNVPAGAVVIGPVGASRCHRNMFDKPPSRSDVISDLAVAAFAKGADGIARVTVTENVAGALFKDC